ncbi:postsynaptic membrane assembly [Dermatophagoides pteronyssinus]|uniref:Postsynaptic membrane assembly n=1 Tax=Dermatophagoides pteronyssinus TaxID=6956 RepID=A0ABQ8JEC4_DERPT|nr:postsynaptic membrane assembly [Dermatophagoides pteronyssinus]
MRPKPFRLIQYQYLLLSLLVVFYCFGLVFSTSSSSSSTLTSITNHQRFQSDNNNNISLSTTSVSSLQIDNNNNNNNVLSPSSSTIILSNHINTTTTVIPNLMMMFNSSTSDTNVYLSKENVDFVQTKYGALQGIVITFVRYNDDDDDSDNEKSTSTSSTSSPSANQNHNNSSSSSSIPTPIITLTPVEAFLGVPYATPPSGNLRFMPPVAPVHWRGVRQANHLSPVCPQSLPFSSMNLSSSSTIDSSELQQKLHISPRHYERLQRQIPFLSNQSEDCLYLNIYVPFEQYYQHRLYQRQRQQQQQQQNRKLKSTSTSSFGNCFFLKLSFSKTCSFQLIIN